MLSGSTYDEVCNNFKWEIPEYYNIGVDVCDKWAGVMLSPEAGKRISDLVSGKMDPKDNPLRPTRFKEGLGKKGKTLMSH